MNTPLYIIVALTPWLAILCYYDCRFRRLPNVLTLGMALVALAWRLGEGGGASALSGFAGGLLCGLFLLLPFYLRGAGGGDVKMLFAVGCAIGLSRCALVLLLTSLAGVLLAIIMLLCGMADAKRLRHCLRSIFDWRYDRKAGRENLPPKNDEKSRVPFGVAIAAGTWLALFFELLQKGVLQ